MKEYHEDRPRPGAEQRTYGTTTTEQDAFSREQARIILWQAQRGGVSPQQAQEIVQIVWRKFLEQGPAFTGTNTTACRAWLGQVTRNEVATFFRELARQPERGLDRPEELPSGNEDESAAHEVLLRRSALFRRWLEQLGQKNPLRRGLVWAKHIEGIRPADLAQVYGKTSHWISKQINLALNNFRAWLVKHGYNEEEA